jgi:hypothetical protein
MTMLPWGNYRYLRVPMGIQHSQDTFQRIMQESLGDSDFA